MKLPAIALLLSCLPASAAFVTLTSPNGNWSLSSDEFGAYGEGAAGSFAQRNFGAGLTGYSWAQAVMMVSGANFQWLGSAAQFTNGGYTGTALAAANLQSDTTVANVRTSVYTTGALANFRITLTQTATNTGFLQNYSIQNLGASTANISMVQFHDVDLDAATFLSDRITASNGYLGVSESARNVFFGTGGVGYAGFLAAHHPPNGGITGNLNPIAQTNLGIPAGTANTFRDVAGAAIGANMDTNNDGISDTAMDVGYLMQHNVSIPAGGSVNVSFLTGGVAFIPEPSTLSLAGLVGLLALRRRR